jgi:hypothetical protein
LAFGSPQIVFLVKINSFEDKLKSSALSNFFPEYEGSNEPNGAAQFLRDKLLEHCKRGSGERLHLLNWLNRVSEGNFKICEHVSYYYNSLRYLSDGGLL